MLVKIEDDVGEYLIDFVEKVFLVKVCEDFFRLYKFLVSKDFGKFKRYNLFLFIV